MKSYFLRRLLNKPVTCKVKRKSISPVKRPNGFIDKLCLRLSKKK